MVKKKKKKIEALVKAPTRSRRVARRVTSEFHKLAEKTALEKDREKKKRLRHQLEAARPAYQEASVVSTQLYSTSRWIIRTLRLMNALSGRCLEVGAINTQLLDVSELETRAIDKRSVNPRIENLDFFDLKESENYEIVVCSLVLNCLRTPLERGRMLQKLTRHATNFLFIVLPRTCFAGADREEQFILLLQSLNFDLACKVHHTPKLAHFCLRRSQQNPIQLSTKKTRAKKEIKWDGTSSSLKEDNDIFPQSAKRRKLRHCDGSAGVLNFELPDSNL
mmetsp:Transcript_18041/g.23528  ORF Transcript_18041/g.23528 Transcript_18041/m.23528 type:complete len:278 (+) Transcript_18041:231-1064(+)